MKKLLLILLLSAWCAGSAFAQTKQGIEFSYNHNLLDKNLTLDYHRSTGRHDVYIGALYHLYWHPVNDGQYYIQKGFAYSFGEHFGFDGGYQFHFGPGKTRESFSPFFFYNLQVTHMGLKLPAEDWNSYGNYYKVPAFWATMHNAGIGINTHLGKGFWLTHQLGAGLALMADRYSATFSPWPSPVPNPDWSFIAPFYRVGFRYDFAGKVASAQ